MREEKVTGQSKIILNIKSKRDIISPLIQNDQESYLESKNSETLLKN